MKKNCTKIVCALVFVTLHGLAAYAQNAQNKGEEQRRVAPRQDTTVTITQRRGRFACSYVAKFADGQKLYFSSRVKDTPQGMVSFAPMFRGKNYRFVGEMREFVSEVGQTSDGKVDVSKRVVSAAHLKYTAGNQKSPTLAQSGIVRINDRGIVETGNAKSGWINSSVLIPSDKSPFGHAIRLDGVSFWVNKGGRNWLAFKVRHAALVEVKSTTMSLWDLESDLFRNGGNDRRPKQWEEIRPLMVDVAMKREKTKHEYPIVTIEKSHRFRPVLRNLDSLEFELINKRGTQN